MDVIIDANCSSDALTPKPHADFAPLLKAILEGEVKIRYGGTKLINEYKKIAPAWRYLKVLDQSGRAAITPNPLVDAEQKSLLEKNILCSDDPHVIALARVSGARLLCSRDQALHADFGNPKIINKPRGKIYQNATHFKLCRSR